MVLGNISMYVHEKKHIIINNIQHSTVTTVEMYLCG